MIRSKAGTLTRDFRIEDLLAQIDNGELVLPEFQRDFDWGDDRVSQLLATVARRWPAGSLLLQEFTDETFFKLRQFDGGPPVVNDRVAYTVLDGQQRLTALYHAIYDSGKYVFAVRASALKQETSIEGLEDSIRSFRRTEWDGEHRTAPWSDENDWIPFYALKSPADFFAWRDEAIRRGRLGSVPSRADAETLSEAYRLGLEAFHTYTLPAVVVEKNLEPEAVARIFERVNRGGLYLSAFDLMVAKTFEPGWNLRDKWLTAQNEHPRLSDFFGDDGMPVIRSIALKMRDSVREGDVLRLPGLAVRQDWDAAARAMEQALLFLKERCGVRRPEWLPYGGMLITLAGLALEENLYANSEIIEAWFWTRAFGLKYEGGANTVTVDEYHHLRAVLQGEVELALTPMYRQTLLEATRKRRSALWRAFMAALSAQGARDPISGDTPDTEKTVAMHVLPRQPETSVGEESQHLRVLNLILVSTTTSRRLAGAGIDNLYSETNRLVGLEGEAVRESQFLPIDYAESSASEFLEARLDLLEAFLRGRVGQGFVDGPPSSSPGLY